MITPLRLMQKTDDPEEELVMQAQAGSHAAFEALYRMHLGHVYGICMRILTDRSRAEEVTQKIFIHAWVKLQSFRGESRFSSWLYRLSVNMILDQLKLVGWKNDSARFLLSPLTIFGWTSSMQSTRFRGKPASFL
jgi:RNA polymerase sigma-70 factor (ECF subfamily)